MDRGVTLERHTGWDPLRGSWEEAVLSWNEQVDTIFRRRRADYGRRTRDRRAQEASQPTNHTSL